MHQNYINGEWLDGYQASENINPSDLRDVIGAYAVADAKQAEQAVAAAHAVVPGWAAAPILQRANALDFVANEVAARCSTRRMCSTPAAFSNTSPIIAF